MGDGAKQLLQHNLRELRRRRQYDPLVPSTYEWQDRLDGRRRAATNGDEIGIQERPATPDPKGINGKYPYRINDKSIEVKVGYFSLNAYIKAPQWRTDHDKMISAIKALVDLDGLAGIKPKQ